MKIVFVSDLFSESMGYAAMCLPKSLAALGHDVHVLTSNAQVYYDESFYKEVYEHFLGPPFTEYGVRQFDGYTLHRMPFETINGRFILKGLFSKLNDIRPDIVQTFSITTTTTFHAAIYKFILGYQLFTANHVLASVFPAAQKLKPTESTSIKTVVVKQPVRRTDKFSTSYLRKRIKSKFHSMIEKTLRKERFVNRATYLCYPATIDAIDIAVRFFGVSESKIKLNILGVDTDVFKPNDSDDLDQQRNLLRNKLGFNENDIVCIYTGRFTDGKNPLCLAEAIGLLNSEGRKFKALFIGHGPQGDTISKIPGCKILPFMHYKELANYYRMADIGVWPMQESTSVLDASACGLPVVISDQVLATERKEGNGVTYRQNDVVDMKTVLLKLEDKNYRRDLGKLGTEKIMKNQAWIDIARRRADDYADAIRSKR